MDYKKNNSEELTPKPLKFGDLRNQEMFFETLNELIESGQMPCFFDQKKGELWELSKLKVKR